MLSVGRSLLQRCSFLRIAGTSSPYSTTTPESPNVPKINELAEEEPVIPDDVIEGFADTEEVAMIRQKLPYSQKVLKELKLDQYPYYVEKEWWKKGTRMTFWATWKMLRDVRRRECLAEYGPERMRLKAIKWNSVLPQAIRDEASERLHDGLPRYSRPSLLLNMCQFTGKPRGKIKRYRVSRHVFRDLADHGKFSGVQRAMW